MKATLKKLAKRAFYSKDWYWINFSKHSIELGSAACFLEEQMLEEKEIDFSTPQQTKLFEVKFPEDGISDEIFVNTVRAEMNKESHHPASFEELIIFLYQNREKYLSNDEEVLWEIGPWNKIIALGGGTYELQGTRVSPFYRIRHESLGSSIDRDLSHHAIPELGILYFGEKDREKYWRNPYYLVNQIRDKEQLFLGIAD